MHQPPATSHSCDRHFEFTDRFKPQFPSKPHPKSAFLDVEQFPLITFKNTSAQRVNAQQYNLTGDLTFHGVTKQLTLRSNLIGQSQDSKGQSRIGSHIYLVIKRSGFGIKGGSPAVGDDIFLTIRVRN